MCIRDRYYSDDFVVSKYGTAEISIRANQDSSVELFFDNAKKFETTTFGSKVTGYLQVTSGVDVTGGNIDLVDNSKIRLGTSQDLQIYHDGSNSYIKDVGTGSIIINGDFFRILNSAGNSQMFRCDANDSVQLYLSGPWGETFSKFGKLWNFSVSYL